MPDLNGNAKQGRRCLQLPRVKHHRLPTASRVVSSGSGRLLRSITASRVVSSGSGRLLQSITASRVVSSGSGRLLQSITTCENRGHSASSSSRTFMVAPVDSSSAQKVRQSISVQHLCWRPCVGTEQCIQTRLDTTPW